MLLWGQPQDGHAHQWPELQIEASLAFLPRKSLDFRFMR
jgi:hypothetical protein